MFDPKLKEALGRVQKPGRYTGGEPGSVYKDKQNVDVRFAFCFPRYLRSGHVLSGRKDPVRAAQQPRKLVVRARLHAMAGYESRDGAPWPAPVHYGEQGTRLTAFDAVGFTLQYELSYTNILAMLDLAGIPFCSKDRDESWPLIVAGGPCACNAEPIADFF